MFQWSIFHVVFPVYPAQIACGAMISKIFPSHRNPIPGPLRFTARRANLMNGFAGACLKFFLPTHEMAKIFLPSRSPPKIACDFRGGQEHIWRSRTSKFFGFVFSHGPPRESHFCPPGPPKIACDFRGTRVNCMQ